MYPHRSARLDPGLSARIVDRLPLFYAGGGDDALDQPAHVRSASSLAWVGSVLAVIQDDANFIAVFDPADRTTRPIMLPAGHRGLRLFDDRRGNKKWKLDLEASVVVGRPTGTMLIAFGSGSTHKRERLVVVEGWESGMPEPRLVEAAALYERLRRESGFAGSQLNLEGAVIQDQSLRLFSRGTGKAKEGRRPPHATCDLDLAAFLTYLSEPDRGSPPAPADVTQYDLGTLGSTPLGFTDAAAHHRSLLYTASAETSADATEDGPVSGSALGVIDPSGSVRWTAILDQEGKPFAGKVEGIAVDRSSEQRVFVVTDADDPDAASELCTVLLEGSWHC